MFPITGMDTKDTEGFCMETNTAVHGTRKSFKQPNRMGKNIFLYLKALVPTQLYGWME